jgi:hypothetical protein
MLCWLACAHRSRALPERPERWGTVSFKVLFKDQSRLPADFCRPGNRDKKAWSPRVCCGWFGQAPGSSQAAAGHAEGWWCMSSNGLWSNDALIVQDLAHGNEVRGGYPYPSACRLERGTRYPMERRTRRRPSVSPPRLWRPVLPHRAGCGSPRRREANRQTEDSRRAPTRIEIAIVFRPSLH